MGRQLVKALNETEKLKAAADAYKKELLQQKLAEKEWDLQQAQDRTKELEVDNNSAPDPTHLHPRFPAFPAFHHYF